MRRALTPICAGCRQRVTDPEYILTSDSTAWHEDCAEAALADAAERSRKDWLERYFAENDVEARIRETKGRLLPEAAERKEREAAAPADPPSDAPQDDVPETAPIVLEVSAPEVPSNGAHAPAEVETDLTPEPEISADTEPPAHEPEAPPMHQCPDCSEPLPHTEEYFHRIGKGNALKKICKEHFRARTMAGKKNQGVPANLSRETSVPDPEPKLRECTRCDKKFPPTHEHFSPNDRTADGLNNYCVRCEAKEAAPAVPEPAASAEPHAEESAFTRVECKRRREALGLTYSQLAR
ncbi:MAG: hypothetical protein KY468_12285, partial [Armatimonadetes bacterium]|nr:hypothetical protein [Armatimonadota bacterium]